MSPDDHSLDVLGTKPLAEATQSALDGVGTFLGRICMPAAEEFGLLLRDKVSRWRANNASRVAKAAEALIESRPDGDKLQAHPRIVWSIVEHSSWTDEDVIQSM